MTPEQIKKLPREQKTLLLDAIAEKEKRLRESKALYQANAGQVLVHKSTATQRVVTSGNGSGKSTLLLHEVFWTAQGYHPVREEFIPVPNSSIILLDSPDKITNLYLPEIHKWFNVTDEMCVKHGKPYVTEIILKNGSSIRFMLQGQEPLVFESIQIDGIIAIDEPCARWQYVALRRGARVRNRVAKVLMVGTPIAQAWVRKEILERWSKGELPDTECFKFGTKVNERNLSDGFIESFSRILSEQEKKVRLDGEFFDLTGLALSHLFDRCAHCVDPFEIPGSWPCVLAIDPHPSKAHVAMVLTCSPEGELYYVAEMARKEPPRTFAYSLLDLCGFNDHHHFRIIDIVCDSLGSADGTGGEGFKSFIQVLNEVFASKGLRARSTTWDEKQDEAFIARIQDALLLPAGNDNFGNKAAPKLRFFNTCFGIVNNIENVQWEKRRLDSSNKPKLDITDMDYLAALKYALSTNLSPARSRETAVYRPRPATSYGMKSTEPVKTQRLRSQFGRFIKRRQALKKEEDDW